MQLNSLFANGGHMAAAGARNDIMTTSPLRAPVRPSPASAVITTQSASGKVSALYVGSWALVERGRNIGST